MKIEQFVIFTVNYSFSKGGYFFWKMVYLPCTDLIYFFPFFSVLQQNSMFLLWRATLKSWWRSGHASFFLHWSRIFRRSQLGKKWYYHTVLYIFWIKTWTCFTKHGAVKNIILDTLFSIPEEGTYICQEKSLLEIYQSYIKDHKVCKQTWY